jgi:23S rRNA (adenine2503-C2)-methyltransferase
MLPIFDPAPERAAPPSLWSLLPADLKALGHVGDPVALFSRVQRGTGDIGARAQALLDGATDKSLPVIEDAVLSADGARRVVLATVDGHRIEAVHMPRATRNPRTTFCVSSQVGCAMGCTFCATGSMGIRRNLSAGEIVGQVQALMRAHGPATGHSLNVVFMGMGEPLHNLDHVRRAVEVLCHESGIGMSPNRITVSTSGLVPGIAKLATWPVRPLLALSLNATTDAQRSRVMPVNRAWGLAALKDALAAFPLRRGEKILLEYVLLRGENDSLEDADRLAEFARGLRCTVNLIPLNEHARTAHRAPDDAWVSSFFDRVASQGQLVTVRANRGRDVRGACGQLVQEPDRGAQP